MRKKQISALMMIFLFSITLFAFFFFNSQVVYAQDTIYVGSGAGNDSSTINGGIALAKNGDTVFVYSGVYLENVLLDKSINLTGEGNITTIIDGDGGGDGLYVTASWVNISGFTVTNGNYGIHLDSASNNMIYNNIIHANSDGGIFLIYSSNNYIANNNLSQNYYGIHIKESSDNNAVENNIVWNNSINGIYLSKVSNNNVKNNRISHNSENGIYLFTAMNLTIKDNDLTNNSHGIYLTASSRNNSLVHNRILNNDYGIYLGLAWNNTIMENDILHSTWHGLRMSSSSNNNTVTNNNISYNGRHGITISLKSTNNLISHNEVWNNDDGFNISNSFNNTIKDNDIRSNSYIGIFLSSSSNCTILNNTISNNQYGFYLTNSTSNSIFHNNIIDNPIGAYDDASFGNFWDGGYPMGGNFWSDWTIPDNMKGPSQNITGSDGIVDNPYEIDLDSRDNYPLTMAKETAPPQISNVQPLKSSIINTSFPTIYAYYFDDSGINVSSAILKINGIEVTPASNATSSNITYTPSSPLTDGIQIINLWIMDYWGNQAFTSWSFEIDTTSPGTITDLSVIDPTSDSITLTWTAPGDDDNIKSAQGYIVKYSISGPISSSNWADAMTYSQSWVPLESGEIETHMISGLFPGTQYWVAIIAYDEVNNRADVSNSADATTLNVPWAPQNPQTYPGNAFVNITWEDPIWDGGSPIINYVLYRGTISGAESYYTGIEDIGFYNDSNVTNGATYYYKVSAKNIVGEGPQSIEVNATPITVPSEPSDLNAISGDFYVNITWDPPESNGGSPILSYILYRRTQTTELTFLSETDITSFYQDTNVTNGLIYFYVVSAKNKAGEGPRSIEVSAMPSTVPSAPTDLSAKIGDSYVHLFWVAPYSNGGSNITNYLIYRGAISGNLSLLIVVGNTLQYNDTQVQNNITYYYRVSAKNAIGEGPYSHTINATPQSTYITPEDETKTEEDGTNWLIIGIVVFIISVIIVLIIVFTIRKRKEFQSKTDSPQIDEELMGNDMRDELVEKIDMLGEEDEVPMENESEEQ